MGSPNQDRRLVTYVDEKTSDRVARAAAADQRKVADWVRRAVLAALDKNGRRL